MCFRPGLPDQRQMEREKQDQIDDVENKIASLQQHIQSVEKTITENSALVRTAVAQLEASLKPALEAQTQQTIAAEQALFSRAFEHGHQLSEDRTSQRVLCQYLRENSDAASIKARITEDCEAQKKHVPSGYLDIIEPPGYILMEATGGHQTTCPSTLLIAFESYSVEQSRRSIECFMKGIDNLDLLSPEKRQAVKTFLKNLLRIFKVHGPSGQYDQLMAQLTSAADALKITEAADHHQPKRVKRC
ncbi:hypothetical protein [Endozoicomonas sp. SCSIO W0465]|uniref:hypothetical protein n=1 Tax=Endozoicomonas sp. SCSIO W0465 TaxID=2918516 RepID=UPI002075FB45|nr:hypothetical protein [Endozoicomonas sp. SCSIO W0465]USE39889.1 hypothetical protein MJO57_12465 [Endozoicomonas sp. SCSIO W0465]